MNPQRGPINRDIERMRASLRIFHQELGGLVGSNLWPTPPGSQAARELASSAAFRDEMHTALSQGAFLVESAADHLMLFAKALDDPIQPLASLTCARGVIEASAVAAWLLDPAIDAKERVGRIIGRRVKGLDELRKLGSAAKAAETKDHAIARIDQATRRASELGIPVATVPGATDVIKLTLDNEFQYRLFSAVAHGHNWALIEVGYGAPETLSEEEGICNVPKQVNPTFTCYAGLSALRAIKRAAWCMTMMFDLDRKRFAEIVEGYYARIGASPLGDLYWRAP